VSRLYASIDSDARKTQATSRGHKNLSAHVRGWDSGVEVVASVNPETGTDEFHIYLTSGSNGGGSRELCGVVTPRDFKTGLVLIQRRWGDQS
jgi:poly(3-hydroxybutyrate) depolymerase